MPIKTFLQARYRVRIRALLCFFVLIAQNTAGQSENGEHLFAKFGMSLQPSTRECQVSVTRTLDVTGHYGHSRAHLRAEYYWIKVAQFCIPVVMISAAEKAPYESYSLGRSTAVVLGGGPGQGGMTSDYSVTFWAQELLSQDRYTEIILYDAPGTQGVEPYPFDTEPCKAVDRAYLNHLRAFEPSKTALLHELSQLTSCFKHMSENGDNLPQDYSTAQQALWLEAILIQLERFSVSLIGISYGTRLADLADLLFERVYIRERIVDGYYPIGIFAQADDPNSAEAIHNFLYKVSAQYFLDEEDSQLSRKSFDDTISRLKTLRVRLSYINRDYTYAEEPLALSSLLLQAVASQLTYDASSWWRLGELISKTQAILSADYPLAEKQWQIEILWRPVVSSTLQFLFDPDFSAPLYYLTECQDRFAFQNHALGLESTYVDESEATEARKNRCDAIDNVEGFRNLRHRATCTNQLAVAMHRSSQIEEAKEFIKEHYAPFTAEDFQLTAVCDAIGAAGLLVDARSYSAQGIAIRSRKDNSGRDNKKVLFKKSAFGNRSISLPERHRNYSPRVSLGAMQDLATPLEWTYQAQKQSAFPAIIAHDTAHSVIYHQTCARHWTAYLPPIIGSRKDRNHYHYARITQECNQPNYFD